MSVAFKIPIPKKTINKTPAQALPIKSYEDRYLKMSDGTYRCIIKVKPINHDLLEDDENDGIVNLMKEAINASAQNIFQITVSSERLNLDEYADFLKQKHSETSQTYYLERIEAVQKYVSNTSIRQRTTKSFYMTISTRHSDYSRAIEEFGEIERKVSNALSSAEIDCSVMNKDESMQMLYEKLCPITSVTQPWHAGMNTMTSIAPGHIKHAGSGEDYSIIDGMYYRSFAIINFPMDVKSSWMKTLLNVNAEIDTSIILNPTGKHKIISSIDESIGFIQFEIDRPDTKASRKNELQKRELSAIELIDQLSSEDESMFNVTVVVTVKEKSLKALDIVSDRVNVAIAGAKMSARQLILMNNDPFWLSLPICYKSDYLNNPNMQWQMSSTSVASILPFDSSDFMMTKGVIKGKNPNTDSPIILDRTDKTKVDNSNEVVIGPSGRGKTWYAMGDISRENSLGTKIFVIDPEREYKFKTGERVVFSIGSTFCTNPFHIRSAVVELEELAELDDNPNDYTEDVGRYLQRKIADSIPFYRYIYPQMDSTEEADLTKAIQETYAEFGLTFDSKELPDIFPTLSDLDKICHKSEYDETLKTFRKNLRPYVTGIYKNMFNGQTNWSMDSMLTVLDIHSLSDVIQPQMMYLLLQDIWEYIKIDRDERKGFYVDEAWKLASPDNPQALKFLFQLAKRIRKYGGYLTTITQNVEDFFSSGSGSKNYGQAIFDNAFIKVFLGLSENDYRTLQNVDFKFSKKEERILKRRKSKGRGVLVVGSTRVELQSTPLVDELQFIDPKEYELIQQFSPETDYAEARASIG